MSAGAAASRPCRSAAARAASSARSGVFSSFRQRTPRATWRTDTASSAKHPGQGGEGLLVVEIGKVVTGDLLQGHRAICGEPFHALHRDRNVVHGIPEEGVGERIRRV